MKKLFLIMSLFLQAGGQPIPIVLQNPSFDQDFHITNTDPCGPHQYGVAGWISGGVLEITNPNSCGIPLPPNGGKAAMIGYGTSISQTVQIPKMPVGLYTFTFYVGNYFYWYPGMFTTALSIDSFYESPLCSVSAHPLGDWTQLSLVCPVRDLPAGNLKVSISSNPKPGWTTLIAGPVSLTFTPTN